MISLLRGSTRRISLVRLHALQLSMLCGAFILLALVIYAGLDHILTPYYHQELLHDVHSSLIQVESDVSAALVRQDYEAANTALDQIRLNQQIRSKQLHVYSPENFTSYSLGASCKSASQKSYSWGLACISPGVITVEIPIWSADNLLGHIQLSLNDDIWSWAPLRLAQGALVSFVVLVSLLCGLLLWNFRRTFGTKIEGFLQALNVSDDPDQITGKINELPLSELHELSSRLVTEMRKHANFRENEQRIEFQNRLLNLGQQLDHAIKNRVARVADVLETENLRRPAKAMVLETFSECTSLIHEKLKRVEEYQKDLEVENILRPVEPTKESDRAVIGDVISAVLASYRPCFDAAGIDFRFSISSRAAKAKVLLTDQELNHIVSNLIQNAIEAVRDSAMDKRMIEVHVSVAQGVCEFSIQDSGLGFSDAVLNQLRSGEVFTTKSNGNGVGTKVARTLLRDAGGTIHFGSSRDGGAETFVQIPVSGY